MFEKHPLVAGQAGVVERDAGPHAVAQRGARTLRAQGCRQRGPLMLPVVRHLSDTTRCSFKRGAFTRALLLDDTFG